MSVYGDQLAFFPEQFETFNSYSAKPEIIAGLQPREFIKSFRGIFQFVKSDELDREGDTLNATEVPTLWTREVLKKGTYIVNPSNPEDLYIVNKSNNYKFQGGFVAYVLELVVGAKDSQKPNTSFGYGQYD